MVISMTGFGRNTVYLKGKSCSIEIKSVNSKNLDLSCVLPGFIKSREMEIRNLITKELIRGKIEFKIFFNLSENNNQLTLNKPLVRQFYKELMSIEKELGWEQNVNYLDFMARIPEIIQAEDKKLTEKEWQKILSGCKKAIKENALFRKTEGNALDKDLKKRLSIMETLLKKVEKQESARIQKIASKLKTAKRNHFISKFDPNRFEEEMIYYLEKLDITEERVRFIAHCDHFKSTLKGNSPNGKKLGFIAQEMLREANTIGAKAGDAQIQRAVVEIKDEIEKVKEQLFNIL